MKITEYPSVNEISDSNVFILDGDNGTKQIAASNLRYALFDGVPEMHSNMYRGKNLGSTFTIEQKNSVQNGTFHDLWIGDYWHIGDIDYRIADFDYFYGKSTNSVNRHHLVIVPDQALYYAKMETDSNNLYAKGYTDSYMYKTGLENAKTTVLNAFQSNVITIKKLHVVSRTGSGISNSVRYDDVQVDLLDLYMALGTNEGTATISSSIPTGPIYRQLKLFWLNNKALLIPDNKAWWTSSQNSATIGYMVVGVDSGNLIVKASNDSSEAGVRPFFCIG